MEKKIYIEPTMLEVDLDEDINLVSMTVNDSGTTGGNSGGKKDDDEEEDDANKSMRVNEIYFDPFQ